MPVPYDHGRDVGRALGLLQEWVEHGAAEATQLLLRESSDDDFDWTNTMLALVRVAATLADTYADEHELDSEGAVELAAIELDVTPVR